VANSLNELINEAEEFLQKNDALLLAEFPGLGKFLKKKKTDCKKYFRLLRDKIPESDPNENFLTELEKDLVKFLLKRDQSLVEKARPQSRNKYEMKDRERFILGLWLAQDIADIKER
jgi:hypothetical protein